MFELQTCICIASQAIPFGIPLVPWCASMDTKTALPLVLVILCLFSSASNAFNITKILSNYPDYGNFNDLLSQTGLAKEINSRQTITVLAVENSAVGAISGKPTDLVKRILSSHVVLDYYDKEKLSKLNKKSTILTTLYQTTGTAEQQTGFLNCTKTPDGIKFGSAAKGAPLVASLVGSVTAQPYNISVLHVSQIIEAPGIDNSPPSPPTAAPKKAPAPEPSAESPAPSEDDAPTESPTEGPAPADAPEADAPEADAPEADAPEADSPEADSTDDKTADGPSSGSAHSLVGHVAVLMGVVTCMVAL